MWCLTPCSDRGTLVTGWRLASSAIPLEERSRGFRRVRQEYRRHKHVGGKKVACCFYETSTGYVLTQTLRRNARARHVNCRAKFTQHACAILFARMPRRSKESLRSNRPEKRLRSTKLTCRERPLGQAVEHSSAHTRPRAHDHELMEARPSRSTSKQADSTGTFLRLIAKARHARCTARQVMLCKWTAIASSAALPCLLSACPSRDGDQVPLRGPNLDVPTFGFTSGCTFTTPQGRLIV